MEVKFSVNSKIKKDEIDQKLKRILFRCMLKMHQLAVQKVPVDTGRLKGSLMIYPSGAGYSEYKLFDGVEYGAHVEFGTSPHHVSAKNLTKWSGRKLGDASLAYAVANKISKFGTNAQPFMRPALSQVKEIYSKAFFRQEFP